GHGDLLPIPRDAAALGGVEVHGDLEPLVAGKVVDAHDGVAGDAGSSVGLLGGDDADRGAPKRVQGWVSGLLGLGDVAAGAAAGVEVDEAAGAADVLGRLGEGDGVPGR